MAKKKNHNKISIGPIVVILLLIGLVVYWVERPTFIDKTGDVIKCLEGSLLKYGISDDNLVRRHSEDKASGGKRYLHASYEYNAPKPFVAKGFEADIKAKLAKAGFKVADIDHVIGKETELFVYSINYGTLDIFTLKLTKRRLVPPVKPAPEIVKKAVRPKVAIVIDDFGYTMSNINQLFAIKEPVTLSVLPHVKYSTQIARDARAKGYEVILHLPLEPSRSDVGQEKNTITTKMTDSQIVSRLASDLQSVPGITGVSNHMGSKATEDRRVMTDVIGYLKKKNLYFFDSFTSQKSVCGEVSKSLGQRCARRDIFLDNSSNVSDIEAQVVALKKMAFKSGQAIAICHDRTSTIKVLAKMMPELSSEGIEFVSLSELVR